MLAGGARHGEQRRHGVRRLVGSRRRRIEYVVESPRRDRIGIAVREPGQPRPLAHFGRRQGEGGQPAAEGGDQLGMVGDHAGGTVLRALRGVLGVVGNQHQLCAAERPDAAGGVHVVDRHFGAEPFQDALARPGAGEGHQHADLDLPPRRARRVRQRRGAGSEAKAEGGPAADRRRAGHCSFPPCCPRAERRGSRLRLLRIGGGRPDLPPALRPHCRVETCVQDEAARLPLDGPDEAEERHRRPPVVGEARGMDLAGKERAHGQVGHTALPTAMSSGNTVTGLPFCHCTMTSWASTRRPLLSNCRWWPGK